MSKRGLPDALRMRHDEHYVESLAASAGQPVGKIVPIDLLDPNPNQPRQAMGDLSELIASVSERSSCAAACCTIAATNVRTDTMRQTEHFIPVADSTTLSGHSQKPTSG